MTFLYVDCINTVSKVVRYSDLLLMWYICCKIIKGNRRSWGFAKIRVV